jgi:hypothetical protein
MLQTIWNGTDTFSLSAVIVEKSTSRRVCDGYNGVLLIDHGAPKAGAGAMFFFLILNQLIYADIHNLKPWIHINNLSAYVYDQAVHDHNNEHPIISFEMVDGMKVVEPHLEPMLPTGEHLTNRTFVFTGNGVWNSYLEPVSDFPPSNNNDDESCRTIPLVRVLGKIHNRGPSWVVKAWKYGGDNGPVHLPFHQWIEPHRQRGHDVVHKYYRFLPHIREAVDAIMIPTEKQNKKNCLAMHIRHSDKSSRRRIIPTSAYLEYVQAYVRAGSAGEHGGCIYLATDSARVYPEIQAQWPASIQNMIITQGEHVIRSNDTQPVFALAGHHQTNTEIFIDILAMSQCSFLLHTLSSVAEATIFLNLHLHNRSVNLEDAHPMSVTDFEDLVRRNWNPTQSTTIL